MSMFAFVLSNSIGKEKRKSITRATQFNERHERSLIVVFVVGAAHIRMDLSAPFQYMHINSIEIS